MDVTLTDLTSISDSGAVPSTRIKSAQQVREIYNKAVRDNEIRSRQNALVKGLVDGNPPYEQQKLDAAGQRYRANFNTGEAESFLNSAKDAFYDLFSEVPHYATVTVDIEANEAVEWGDKITKHFDWLQKQDDLFDYTIQTSQHDTVLYGMGPVVRDDGLDWRPKRVSAVDVYLPQGAPAVCTRWPWVIIYRLMPVGELYNFISDEETARQLGWDVSAVKDAIINTGERGNAMGMGRNWQKWETWQQAFRDGDLWTSETGRKVGVVQMLFQEFSKDGEDPKISEVWVASSASGETDDRYLFHKTNRYENMKQAINPFFYDRGDGSARGVHGLGRKMQKLLLAKMRLDNASVDNAFARSAIMLKSLGGQTQSAMSPVSLGPYTVLPNGFEVIQGHQVAGLIDAPMVVSRDLSNTLTSNLGQYRQRMDKPEGNPRTAFEIAQNVSQASNLAKTQIARYYEQLDDLYAETFRRVSSSEIPKTTQNKWARLALEFQARCFADGVPMEVLPFCKVQATRAAGQGSQFMRISMLNSILMTLGGMLPEDGRQNVVRDLVAAQAGQAMVSRYLPQVADRSYEAGQIWEAQVEESMLKDGGAVTITNRQNDVIHLQQHIGFASQAAASVPQGANPTEVLVALEAIGRHSAMHMQRLAANPQRQREAKVIMEQLKQLAAVTDKIRQMAEEQQPKAPENGAPSPEVIKAMKTAKDLQLKEQKQQATLALKAQNQAFNQRMATQKAQFDQSMRDAEMANSILSEREDKQREAEMDKEDESED